MKQYHEIMEHITVDDAMRNRILDNIEKIDLTDSTEEKIKAFPVKNRYVRPLVSAACLALVLVAAVSARTILSRTDAEENSVDIASGTGTEELAEIEDSAKIQDTAGLEDTAKIQDAAQDEAISIAADIVECSSAEELSELVGFDIKDLSGLPFDVTETTYISYWGLAEITYIGDGKELTYRKSIGDEDNSGDYNSYEDTMAIDTDAACLTLKGANNGYNLCTWQKDGYSYSLAYSSDAADTATENQTGLYIAGGLSAAFYETMFSQIME